MPGIGVLSWSVINAHEAGHILSPLGTCFPPPTNYCPSALGEAWGRPHPAGKSGV